MTDSPLGFEVARPDLAERLSSYFISASLIVGIAVAACLALGIDLSGGGLQ